MKSPQLPDLPLFQTIAEAAGELAYPAYVIGGFVRDLALERPSKDVDVVCVGDGIKLAQAVGRKLPNKPRVTVFKNFGTAMLPTPEVEIEFVGARKESYRAESRKPEVEAGTLEEDLARRDFTINALGLSLNPQDFGALVDRYDGMGDLRRKTIRTPLDPDITFSDDPLRMMRAIRFAAQLNFDIDPDTYDALARNKERIKIVSQERITDELNKIIMAPKPSYGFKLLFQSGLLQLIFPKMAQLYGVERVGQHAHKDNFYHTLQVLDNVVVAGGDLWLRWAAILHDIAKPATKRLDPKIGWTFHGHEDKGARWVPQIFTELKLPLGEEMRQVQKLVRLHLRPIALVKETVTDSAVRRLLFEAGDEIDRLMTLCRADITSKDHNRVQRYLRNFDVVEQKLKEVEEKDHLRNFKPVITGEVIMETFGLKPSREVGELKDALLEAILDGKVRNEFEEAFAFLLQLGKAKGLPPGQPFTHQKTQ
ncbi:MULTISPECIES: CCA tRNA nucleotidyltransferase [Hymenobacter]|uniref:HD domain-containing protein n=1 Tax=Hymenobacter jejuensis TaxID=2502781 RepID=A0A5B8A1W9_9BACT|nr:MULTISPECIES: HD domain-containing protein [Hymenobacter]MBC6989361.1 HD domain-containing protein [Hymenobacter sp. BT491]QDA61394.1 HD domain-containing protein [Hymenobacter jejuensis]